MLIAFDHRTCKWFNEKIQFWSTLKQHLKMEIACLKHDASFPSWSLFNKPKRSANLCLLLVTTCSSRMESICLDWKQYIKIFASSCFNSFFICFSDVFDPITLDKEGKGDVEAFSNYAELLMANHLGVKAINMFKWWNIFT